MSASESLYKCVYRLGIGLRNKKIIPCYNSLKQTEALNIDTLQSIQLKRLKELVSTAYSKTEYYKILFDRSGLKVSDIQCLEDLKYIPVTGKDELLKNAGKIQIQDCGEKLFFSETSGSTGKPLVFYKNMEWDAWVNAAVMRGYSWHNIVPWQRNGYLWGYNIAPDKRWKIRFLDSLQNRFRLFSYKDDEMNDFLKKLEKAAFVGGYSSMLYELAKKVNASGNQYKYNLRMVKGTSEKIYDRYQEEVERAFGKRIISEYGSAEGGIIAFECPYQKMHVNMETVIAEEINNEIVVTNLVSKSFPIIRYRLGDYVKIERSTRCCCGMQHDIISEITGRIGSVVYGKMNKYPSLTLYYVFKNLASIHGIVINYQVVQNLKGSIKVLVENDYNNAHHTLMTKEFRKYFADDVDVEVEYNAARQDYSRKRKDFISTITGEGIA